MGLSDSSNQTGPELNPHQDTLLKKREELQELFLYFKFFYCFPGAALGLNKQTFIVIGLCRLMIQENCILIPLLSSV